MCDKPDTPTPRHVDFSCRGVGLSDISRSKIRSRKESDMKQQSGLVVLLCVVVAACSFGWSSAAQNQRQASTLAKVTFEHTATNNLADVERRGAEGWELVSVIVVPEVMQGSNMVSPAANVFYLKRASTNR
jgi:hypothetical protein